MKRAIQIAAALAILGLSFQGCKKAPVSSKDSKDQMLIQSAKAFFESSLQNTSLTHYGNNRTNATKQPYWEAAYCTTSSKGPVVVVPVFYQKDLVVKTTFSGARLLSLNSLTKLVISKDTSGFYSQVVTFFPDSIANASSSQYSGIVFTESWNGQPLHKYKLSGSLALTEKQPSDQSGTSGHVATESTKETDEIISTCTTIYGYNYSSDDPDDTYSWSEPAGCDYEYLAPDISGRGLSPGDLVGLRLGALSLATIVIAPPTNIVANIQDYIKCFSNYGGSDHTYQVTVCVDQPDPGTRDAWGLSSSGLSGSSSGTNPVDVGHTFLVLTENFSGYSIVRNIGFYPQTNVNPWSPSAQGQLNNDDGHSYNISLTVNVDDGQFFNILNYISQGNNAGFMYDLNTNNCTSFALHALEAGDVDLPATVGSWVDGGFGYDPGDLGEDIRNMSLSSNMTRNTTYDDHPNKYTCN